MASLSYAVSLRPFAARRLVQMAGHSLRAIDSTIERLGENPRPPEAHHLDSPDIWCVWSATGHRITYEVLEDEKLVVILWIDRMREPPDA
jgi:mRNA-degrading endonuclease RelE of RelBE toxin-antitoxin system